MAFSSIAHMGYALIGLAAGTAMGVKAMLMYLAIYVTMNIGTFAFILMMERDGKPITDIDALRQYSKRDPGKALAVLILMFSLAGVPPMLGFFAKFGVWQAGVSAGLTGLVIVSAIASVIGAFYYLRIVFYMYFGAENEDPIETRSTPVLWVALMGSARGVYTFGAHLRWAPVIALGYAASILAHWLLNAPGASEAMHAG